MTALSRKSEAYAQGLALAAENRYAEAIERYEAALRENPDDIRVLFALGNTASAMGLAKPAENFFRRVLAAEPARIEALVNLANLMRSEGRFDAAEALLAPALQHNPDSAELWLTLGSVHRERGDAQRAAAHYREALARKPDYPPALGNLADLLADDGAVGDALALYDRALKREPKNAQARLNRAVLHLLQGDLKAGWRDYSARLDITENAPVRNHHLPRWTGSPLKKTRLLVAAEQGVGDQLMFASVIPELCARARQEGGTIFLECEPRLAALFARSFPDAKVRPSRMEMRAGRTHAHYGWLKAEGGANAAIELGSLPRYLRGDLAPFPAPHSYLMPEASEARYWRQQFGPGALVGVCWRSGKTGGARSVQYGPLAAWAHFLRDVPGTIVCAQYDATADEIAELQALSGRTIRVPEGIDQKTELDRACAMLSALDAVVSAPTAVAWLAAGAGVPTFKILYDTSWTCFGQRFEPFAPACTPISPRQRGDWADAFAQAQELLAQR